LAIHETPFPAHFSVRHPFKQSCTCTTLGQNDKNCPGLAFTFVNDRGKAASHLYGPDQTRNFQVCGQPRDYAASFSIEFDSKP
jgi:hypothetical protein